MNPNLPNNPNINVNENENSDCDTFKLNSIDLLEPDHLSAICEERMDVFL